MKTVLIIIAIYIFGIIVSQICTTDAESTDEDIVDELLHGALLWPLWIVLTIGTIPSFVTRRIDSWIRSRQRHHEEGEEE